MTIFHFLFKKYHFPIKITPKHPQITSKIPFSYQKHPFLYQITHFPIKNTPKSPQKPHFLPKNTSKPPKIASKTPFSYQKSPKFPLLAILSGLAIRRFCNWISTATRGKRIFSYTGTTTKITGESG
jgi:hypothetical protein